MPKLFIAIDLPVFVSAALVRLQPSNIPGVRLVQEHQMHLTLNFIGSAENERVTAAIAGLNAAAFELSLDGVGMFASENGATSLWASVVESVALLGLHEAVTKSLATIGYLPESRRYTPHIMIARCGPAVPFAFVEEFLSRHKGFALAGFPCESFSVYSSEFVDDVPVYERINTFCFA